MRVSLQNETLTFAHPNGSEALHVRRYGAVFSVQGSKNSGAGWYIGDFANFYDAMAAVRSEIGGAS